MKKLLLGLLLLVSNIGFAEFQVEVPIERTGYYCSGHILEDRLYVLTQIMYDTKVLIVPSDDIGHCPVNRNRNFFVEGAFLTTITDMSLQTFTLTLLDENLTYYVRVRTCACWEYRPEGRDLDECYFNKKPIGEYPQEWVPLTLEALYESINYDLTLVGEKLNCSNWRTPILYRAEKIPNSREQQ